MVEHMALYQGLADRLACIPLRAESEPPSRRVAAAQEL